MRGKNKCKILKQIRQKIADENDIPYVTQECTFQGECKGTCPKCEAELRYLEQQLERRQRLGKTVTVAALAASLLAGLTACPGTQENEQKSSPKADATFFSDTTESTTEYDDELAGAPTELPEVIGEVPYTPEKDGEVDSEENEEATELEGDVVYIPDESETEIIDPDMIVGMIPVDESTCEIPVDGDE